MALIGCFVQLSFFILTVWVASIEGGAKLQIRFDSFTNPSQLKADGFCCDGEKRGSNCTSTCDYSFQICLGRSSENPCDIANYDAGAADVSDDGDVIFRTGISNSIHIDIDKWQEEVLISFTVYDEDTSIQERVDTFTLTYTQPTPVRHRVLGASDYLETTLHGQRQTEATLLTVAVGVMCDAFYYSDNCSVNCVPSDDCSGHYDCDVVTGQSTCLQGWGGDNCTTQLSGEHGCTADQLCEHGSTCVPYGTQQFYCCCSPGYTGQNCEIDVNECDAQPCLNGASCTQGTPGTYLCQCSDWYTGANCEMPKTCDNNPCRNNSTCIQAPANFTCQCPPYYTGAFCDVIITTTTPTTTTSTTTTTIPTTTSTLTTASSSSACPENYYGPGCRVYCVPVNDCSGHYGCQAVTGEKLCLGDWTGQNCTVRTSRDPACQCTNGGECFNDRCCCSAGFTGPFCETEVSLCAEDTCLNNGTCQQDALGVWCSCQEGFSGDRCQTSSTPACPGNYYGETCSVYCEAQDSCEGGQYTCHPMTGAKLCRFGWLGDECNARDPAAKHEVECPDSTCRNGGHCVNNTCCCSAGYAGSLCHIEILECASAPCQHGGRCRDLIADYVCECQPGFTGKNCETRQSLSDSTTVPSSTDPCAGVSCVNNATCVSGNLTDYVCLCLEGFTGDLCQESVRPLTTTVNPNLPTCSPNYYGSDCSVFCQASDSCGGGHYYCHPETGNKICHNGWIGANCTTRDVSRDNDPECPQGVACLNGGTCFNGSCCCMELFSGAYCEVEQLPCENSPCLNGVCRDLLRDYQCSCNSEYQGRNCQTFVGFSTPTDLPAGFNTTRDSESVTGTISSSNTTASPDNLTTTGFPESANTTVYAYNTTRYNTSNSSSQAGVICGARICYNGGSCRLYDNGVYECGCLSNFQGEQCETAVSATSWSPYSTNITESAGSSNTTASSNSSNTTASSNSSNTTASSNSSNTTASSNSSNTTTSSNSSNTTAYYTTSSVNSTTLAAVSCGAKFCYNGGTCLLNVTGDYVCSCLFGFEGEQCETVISTTTPFANSTNITGSTVSTTPYNTTSSENSSTTATIICGSTICYNGGSCVSPGTGLYQCACLSGFQGEQCDTDVAATTPFPYSTNITGSSITTVSSNSSNTTAYYTTSSVNSTTAAAVICGTKFCYNGGTCLLFASGDYMCTCLFGFEGEQCEKTPSSTAWFPNGTNSTQSTNSYITTESSESPNTTQNYTTTQYYTTSSENTSSATGIICGTTICYNGGSCRAEQFEEYQCACLPGFQGNQCETAVTSTTSNITASTDNSSNTASSNTSTVTTAYYTSSSENSTSAAGIICGSTICYNGGSCILYVTGDSECACLSGFEGDRCETIISTTTPFANGTNITQSTGSSNTTAYYSTSSENSSSTAGIICGSIICYNGGSCVSSDTRVFECACLSNFQGDQCETAVTATTPFSYSTKITESTDSSSITTASSNSSNTTTSSNSSNTTASSNSSNTTASSNSSNTTASSNSSNTTAYYTTSSVNSTTPVAVICGTKFCYNGGTCLFYASGEYVCTCLFGFEGEQCEKTPSTTTWFLNGTSSTQSTNSYITTESSDSSNTTQNYTTTQYYTTSSENSTSATGIICGTAICYNGGSCRAEQFEEYQCACLPGFQGNQCETAVTSTTSNITASTDNSSNTAPSNTSTVTTAYYTSSSENSTSAAGIICGTTICYNGGWCLVDECECLPGFEGNQCETAISSTTSNITASTDNSITTVPSNTSTVTSSSNTTVYNTTSSENSTTPVAVICGTKFCYNGATCLFFASGQYVCTCLFGFQGEQCETPVSSTTPFSTGTNITDSTSISTASSNTSTVTNSSNTTVYNTTSSENSTTPVAVTCGTRFCYNGGRCIRYVTGEYVCSCLSGFQGEQCETPVSTTTPFPNGTNSTELPDSSNTTEYYSTSSENSSSMAGIICGSRICYNGGSCRLHDVGVYECICLSNFQGEQCETSISTSAPNDTNITQSTESVITTASSMSSNTTAYYTTSNQNSTTPAAVICGTRFCYNGGTCLVYASGQYACTCLSSYVGEQCETAVSSTTPFPTRTNITDSTDSSVTTASSNTNTVTSGFNTAVYYSTSSENSSTPAGIICGTKFCYNGATCLLYATGEYVCSCLSGFEGAQCETVISATTPFPNGTNNTESTSSSNTTEYYSTSSENSSSLAGIVCGSKICYNGGSCRLYDNGVYECACLSNFQGEQCETTVFATSSTTDDFLNITVNSTSQQSPSPFSSSTPSTGIACLSKICYNGATCYTIAGGLCVCTSDYSGPECDVPIKAPSTVTYTTSPQNTSQETGSVMTTAMTSDGFPGNVTSATTTGNATMTTMTNTTSMTANSSLLSTDAVTVTGSQTSDTTQQSSTPTTASTPASQTSQSSTKQTSVETATTLPQPTVNYEDIYITQELWDTRQVAFAALLEAALSNSLKDNDCCSQTKIVEQSTFFDPEGTLVYKFRFTYVSNAGQIPTWSQATRDSIYQATDNSLQNTEPFKTTGNRVYTGPIDRLKALADAFSLNVIGAVTEDYRDATKKAIINAQIQADSDCQCSYDVILMVIKPHVGKYGTRLSHIYYYLTRDGAEQTPANVTVPTLDVVAAQFNQSSLPYQVYQSVASVPFDLHYSLLLDSRVKMTDSQGQQVLKDLQNAWQKYVSDNMTACRLSTCLVQVNYVRPQLYYTSNGTVISGLDYFISVNGNKLHPTMYPGPTDTDLKSALVPVCTCLATPVYYIDTSGSLTWSGAQALGDNLFKEGTNSPAVIVERTSFLDFAGSQVTRTFFLPSNASLSFSPPDLETASRIAGERGLTVVKQPIRQQYTVALEGVVDTNSIQTYLVRSWYLTNSNNTAYSEVIPQSEIAVTITSVDSDYFSNKSGMPVTVVTYTVAVASADSSLTIADQPTLATLRAGFQGSSYNHCDCQPLKVRSFSVIGPVNPDNITQLQEAIVRAWKVNNPDFGGNLTVKVQELRFNQTGRNGENLTSIMYTVSPETGTTPTGFTDQDLRQPDNDTIQTALRESDLDLEVYTYHEEEYIFPWWIPVGIVLGLLLLIIIIIIIVCIVRDRRRRQSRDIKQEHQQINGFDKEHFSAEPDFQNHSYAMDDLEPNNSKSATYYVNPLTNQDVEQQAQH